jgi:uroporphyrinogen-III synthase
MTVTIGVTASRRIDEQRHYFERHGAGVVSGPTVRSVSADDEPAFRAATEAVIASPPDVVLLHTGTGVRAWFAGAAELGLDDALRTTLQGTTVYARGPKAVRAAAEKGVTAAWQSPRGRYEDLVERIATHHAGTRVAVQLDGDLDADTEVALGADAGEAERYLVEQLRGHVADVVAVPVYRWALPLDPAPAVALLRRVALREVDAVTFTSSPAVVGLARIAATEGLLDDVRAAFTDGVLATSIGEVCSATLRRHGIAPALEPARPRLGALLVATAAALDLA